jgi:hypothetical protein
VRLRDKHRLLYAFQIEDVAADVDAEPHGREPPVDVVVAPSWVGPLGRGPRQVNAAAAILLALPGRGDLEFELHLALPLE